MPKQTSPEAGIERGGNRPAKATSTRKRKLTVRQTLLLAAEHMDWGQVVLNGGPPCFNLGEDGHFCGRAWRWAGHHGEYPTHDFVSLKVLLEVMADE